MCYCSIFRSNAPGVSPGSTLPTALGKTDRGARGTRGPTLRLHARFNLARGARDCFLLRLVSADFYDHRVYEELDGVASWASRNCLLGA
ncbi:hypothetical protein LIA77_06807 [Sarocladium implicatum]|nr:hypothetical protein LIA77_06807 [Sarocladium implicatum]